MARFSYNLMSVWGIPVRLHWSLALLVYIFVSRVGWTWGLTLAVCIPLSILLHELGHSFVAIRKGCPVREITLMCIGGAAQMVRIPRRPRDEFLMAIAGPAVSLVLGLGLMATGMGFVLLSAKQGWSPYGPVVGLGNALWFLGGINLALVVFNMIPAFPMDGGRILRASLSPKFGRVKATFYAARMGQVLAIAMGYYAFTGFQDTHWMLVAIAFFVLSAAGQEYRLVQAQDTMEKGDWGMYGAPPPIAGEDHDRVVISPPPYAKDAAQETEIHSASRTRSSWRSLRF